LEPETKNSIVGTRIRNTPARIESKEGPTNTKILTLRSRIENKEDPIGIEISMIGSRTKIKLPIENLCSTKILALVEIAKSMNIGQILDLEYQVVNSPSIKLIMDGKLLDESRICLLASIGTFCFFIEIISNE
jgi:hypothetical protein